MCLKKTLQQLADFDTALLANTLGYLVPDTEHEWYMGRSIASITPSMGPTVGLALTCEMDTSTPKIVGDYELFYELLKEMKKSPVPTVLVAKTVGSRPDHECVLGDGMAKELYSVGCIGMVTDGGVRDVEGLLTIPFSAHCRGRTIHHTAGRVVRINGPVEVGGITVRPGEIIHANIGGVIKIAPGQADRLVCQAPKMRAFEHEAHCIFRQSEMPIDEKRSAVARLLEIYKFGEA